MPISLTERNKLVEALLQCHTISDEQKRRTLIEDLPKSISVLIKRNPATLFDVTELVKVCADYEHGIDDLLKALAFYEGNSYGMHEVQRTWEEIKGQQHGRVEIITVKRREFYPLTFSPPTHYIPRTELLDSLRQTLLTPSNEAMTLTSALHGMGGIGKSVMARALCDDSAVKVHFTAGTLVAVLGEQPSEESLKAKLRDWVQTVGGTITENAPSLDYLGNLLRELLHDQTYLLVLDDVWQAAHARPFLQGGSQCRVLLTTRNREVARQLAPTVEAMLIPTMRPAEAVALLASHADPPLSCSEADKLRVVKRLGYLPLAIRLAGAQLAFYDDVAAWLAEFKTVDLEAMSVAEVHDSLRQTFELSLRHLDKPMRQRYQTLAIFKEDEAIPFAALRHGWPDLKPPQLKQTLYLFTQRALVQSQGEGAAQTISLHDLLRDFMADELGEAGKIQAHQTLLTSYRATRRAEGWHTAPDDGYLYHHLTYHLNAVADHDSLANQELHGLFDHDQWLHARLQSDDGQYDGYIDDLITAWQRIQTFDFIALNVRYALIRTSINSLAQNYIPELVARAVETGLWSPQRALSLAKKIPDPKVKADRLIALLTTGKLSAKEQIAAQKLALESSLVIKDEEKRAWKLANLVQHLTKDLREQALTQAFQAALVIKDEENRIKVMIDLARQSEGKLREQVLTQIFKMALAIKDENQQDRELVSLAPQLEGESLIQAFHATLAIENEYRRSKVMVTLVPRLEGESLIQAFHAALAIQSEPKRAEVIVKLVPRLEGELLTQAFHAALAIQSEPKRAEVIVKLVPRLEGELLTQTFQVALAIQDEDHRAKVIVALARQSEGKLREQAFQAALAIKDEYRRAKVIVALAPHLTEELREQASIQAFHAAIRIEDEDHRAEVMVDLAPYLTEELLTQALHAAMTIKNEWRRKNVMINLAPHLTGELLTQAFHAALSFEDEWYRAYVMTDLAHRSEGNLREQALIQAFHAALAIKDLRYPHHIGMMYRSDFIVALAPHLTGELLAQALHAALTIESAKVIAALAPRLKGKLLAQALHAALTIKDISTLMVDLAPWLEGELLTQALHAAMRIEDEYHRAKVFIYLSPHLTGELLAQVFHAAMRIENEDHRVEVMIALARQSEGKLREQALIQAFQTTSAIKPEHTEVLVALVPHLTGKLREQALIQAFLTVSDKWYYPKRVEVMAILVPLLEGESLAQAFQAALAIKDEDHCIEVIVKLVPRLEGELLTQAFHAALAIKDEDHRAEVIVKLVPHLTGELLTQAFQAALAIKDERRRKNLMINLAPHLTGELLTQAFHAALAIKDEYSCSKVIVELAPRLEGESLIQALHAALAIKDEYRRAKVIVELAPRLEGELLTQAFHAALAIKSEPKRAEVMIALARRAEGSLREQVLIEALQTTLAIKEVLTLNKKVMVDLTPHLTGELLAKALQGFLAIKDEPLQTKVLVALAPELEGELLAKAFQAALAIERKEKRFRVLASLIQRLEGEQLAKACQALATLKGGWLAKVHKAALAIEDEDHRAEVIVALTPLIIEDENRHSKANLVPHLTRELQEQSFHEAMEKNGVWYRALALVDLAPRLTNELREQALIQAFHAGLMILDEWRSIEVMEDLAPHLAPHLAWELLTQAAIVRSKGARSKDFETVRWANALVALAPLLEGELLAQAFQAARWIEDERYRTKVLIALAPQLTGMASDQLQAELRNMIIAGLVKRQIALRESVLEILSIEGLFSPAALGVPTAGMVETIVGHIHEICTQWRWG